MNALEKLCLEIRRPKSKRVVVVTYYRPPDANIGLFFISNLDSKNVEYLVTGDLKCNGLLPDMTTIHSS